MLESDLVSLVVLIPRFDYSLVLWSILDVNFDGDLVLIVRSWLLLRWFLALSWLLLILFEGLLVVNLEWVVSETWPLPCLLFRHVIRFHLGCESSDVGMLLLNYLISWQHDEIWLLQESVEDLDEASEVVEISCVE